MKSRISTDIWLALFFLVFAILIVFVWIPMDTGTGLVEEVRRKFEIGDALAPTVAGIVIFIGAVLLLLKPSHNNSLSSRNLSWMVTLLGFFTVSLILMRYTGPIAASWTELGYRPLRATPPWNYIGFLFGGTLMVGGLTSLVKRQLSFKDFTIGFVASLFIALLFDLPFDDLILPPNGDV